MMKRKITTKMVLQQPKREKRMILPIFLEVWIMMMKKTTMTTNRPRQIKQKKLKKRRKLRYMEMKWMLSNSQEVPWDRGDSRLIRNSKRILRCSRDFKQSST